MFFSLLIQEIDAKAGGGQPITIGVMVRQLLTKLDWYDTLFPRIPVPIQVRINLCFTSNGIEKLNDSIHSILSVFTLGSSKLIRRIKTDFITVKYILEIFLRSDF